MLSITLQEALKRPSFSNITILSGSSSMTRSFKWVHVIEKVECKELIDGGELILTTGSEWNRDEATSLYFLQQLLDKNVTALCIELEQSGRTLSDSFLSLAEERDFPVILFNEAVKFVTITQDLHRFILEFEDTMWRDLENLFMRLNQTFLNNGPITDFLQILHEALGEHVVFRQNGGKTWSFPAEDSIGKPSIFTDLELPVQRFPSVPVSSLEQELGTLYLLKEKESTTKFEIISLNRCATFLSQSILLNSQFVEKKQIDQNDWIKEIVAKNQDHQLIIQKLMRVDGLTDIKEISVAIIPLEPVERRAPQNIQPLSDLMRHIRGIMNKYGFQVIATPDLDSNRLLMLIISQRESESLLARIKLAINEFQQFSSRTIHHAKIESMSIGIFVNNYSKLWYSLETAVKAQQYQRNNLAEEIVLYQDLHINRLFGNMEGNMEIEEIIQDYIGPIIEFDKANNHGLLHTLEVFLNNQCSKKQTAEALFIVRQTLYHRLDKIESLLNYDLASPQNRFMCEFAIYAYKHYLTNSNQGKYSFLK